MIKWKENININKCKYNKKFVTLTLLKIEKLTSMGIYLAQWSMTQFESDLKNWNFGVGKTSICIQNKAYLFSYRHIYLSMIVILWKIIIINIKYLLQKKVN